MAGEVTHLLTLASGDTPAARWLASAIRAWCQGQPWSIATGIQPGQVSRAIRDNHLRHAADLLGGDPNELHRQAARFESAIWPRWKRSGPPPEAGLVNLLLYQARQAAPLPGSLRQFQRIVGHRSPV